MQKLSFPDSTVHFKAAWRFRASPFDFVTMFIQRTRRVTHQRLTDLVATFFKVKGGVTLIVGEQPRQT